MQLSVTQENLARALSSVGRVAHSKTDLPILNNILFRTDGNRLLIASTNLEIAATHYIGAKVTKPGILTLPARLITDFVSSLPKGTVDMSVSGTKMTISSGNYTSTINGIDADEFPELPAIDESSSVHYVVESSEFKQAISQTIFTTSSDTTRPVLTGVYWHTHSGYIYLAATDGYRLSERKLVATKSDVSAIIPTTSLQEVLRTMNDMVDEIDVLFDETQVRFRIGDAEIVSRLIDGNYPDYRQLIPKESTTTATVSHDEFSRTVKIAGLFARESGGSIIVAADKEAKNLSIKSVASELGENISKIDGVITNTDQVTLNSRYLTEALGAIEGDTVQFSFSGKLAPCVLKNTDKNSDYLHIIMPLKS